MPVVFTLCLHDYECLRLHARLYGLFHNLEGVAKLNRLMPLLSIALEHFLTFVHCLAQVDLGFLELVFHFA